MKCPKCHTKTKVIDSRYVRKENDYIRRRRKCKKCGGRFTTYERRKTDNPFLGIGRVKNYTYGQILRLAKESHTLEEIGNRLGITKERVRQVAFLLGIREEVLSILKKNRSTTFPMSIEENYLR